MAPTTQEGTSANAVALYPGTLWRLNDLVASEETLKQAGYVIQELTEEELDRKKRCITCGVRIWKKPRVRTRQNNRPDGQQQQSQPETEQPSAGDGIPTSDYTGNARPKPMLCNFHPGRVAYKYWTCCGKHVSEGPCTGKADHDAPDNQDDQATTISQRWQFHATPPHPQPTHRAAVAIDCEMGTALDGDSELIRLTVIDYLSGETLIDSLVYPDIAMKHFNTRWSGVSRGDMDRSLRRGCCIMGRDAARRAVFAHVGPSTVVVGHGAQNDLAALRWIHHRVVDSHILESAARKEAEVLKAEKERAEGKTEVGDQGKAGQGGTEPAGAKDRKPRTKHHPDGMSLKALAMKHLGRAIQVGNWGHDSLEDALAARDLVQAYIIRAGNSAPLG
ncbi:hypothetical protein N658DRAFT_469021 [Parathielavia hyrcaniae]|uniref:Exonuclease domain-containing protein n=1 Tax=Parathielavia hyrcaniae TaxID=113614 RepID=A0AAN6Q2V1_9PEZI|nr:hypothetical protein N658DRAFT_469021 [Parathielavia hyrcaniae]